MARSEIGFLRLVSLLVVACATPVEPAKRPDMPGSGTESTVVERTVLGDHVALRLSDGRTVLLGSPVDATPKWFRPMPSVRPSPRACFLPPYPASVNLQANQTLVRDQGGRDTCTVFAFTAALEAAYRRDYGLTLDLSEQYLNHVQKSHWLNFTAGMPLAEIQSETNGGGNLEWHASVTRRYGLPPETTLPYIGDWDYQDTNQPGDQPSGLDSASLQQRALDDFMLSASPTTYRIPRAVTATTLPQPALESARYRPTLVGFASPADRSSLDWYRSQLACGFEVMFTMQDTGTRPPAGGIWAPGSGAPLNASHSMLIVGYDDASDAFLVKNSWGGTALLWFAYDWVRRSLILEAGVVYRVSAPDAPFGVSENPHLWLGRWNLDHDGWKGTLDVYRLPRPSGSTEPADYRVGTYFGPDGVARRVNGEITGNRMQFTIDWTNPFQPHDVMRGLRFTGYLFSRNHALLAGTMFDDRDGNTYGFHATKGAARSGSAGSSRLDLEAYAGEWDLEHDGWKGTLTIVYVNPLSRVIQASYRASGGTSYPVTGHVNADPRSFTLQITFPGAPQEFAGYLYGHELGLAAGTTTWSGISFGFAMARVERRAPICDWLPWFCGV